MSNATLIKTAKAINTHSPILNPVEALALALAYITESRHEDGTVRPLDHFIWSWEKSHATGLAFGASVYLATQHTECATYKPECVVCATRANINA
jgi:hypothetical protein